MIWWHSKFVDEINRDTPTIRDIIDKTSRTVKELEKLRLLEDKGKIKVIKTGTLNPIYIQILDESIESEVSNNPIVEKE
jgi:hypothetical protein